MDEKNTADTHLDFLVWFDFVSKKHFVIDIEEEGWKGK